MNDGELIAAVNSSMYHQCRDRGYAVPVDVLMDIGVLSKEKHEDWRFGRVPFLEAVCNINLGKLSTVMKAVRGYASKNGLKPSYTCYKQWGLKTRGKKPVVRLRFSKSGNPDIEKAYSTHYVDEKRIASIKQKTADDDADTN